MAASVNISGVLAHIDHRTWDSFTRENGDTVNGGEKYTALISCEGTLYEFRIQPGDVASVTKIPTGSKVVCTGLLKKGRKGDLYLADVKIAHAPARAA